jgi:hypothetical protein
MNNNVIEIDTAEEFDQLTEREKMIVYITDFRLELYHRCLPCGPKAIQQKLRDEGIAPPSISTISRALRRQCLTHGRTGYYGEEARIQELKRD